MQYLREGSIKYFIIDGWPNPFHFEGWVQVSSFGSDKSLHAGLQLRKIFNIYEKFKDSQ